MNLWGECYDPQKAKKFELDGTDADQQNLPPSATEKTKVHPKPTNNLPSDHATAEGETTKAAFPTTTGEDYNLKTDTTTIESTGMPNALDEGTFNHIYDLLSNSTWLVGACGVVVLFGLGAGVFFWLRRRRLQKRNAYSALSGGDDMRMRSIDRDSSARAGLLGGGGSGNTRELYDAFGVLSDEEDHDDDDEESALRGAGGGYDAHPERGLGYHEGFLDDDGPPAAGTSTRAYRDEPELAPLGRDSPGSGDGSWQDASEGVQRT
jgi:kexin